MTLKVITVILGATGFAWLAGLVILPLWIEAVVREVRK